MIIKDIAEYEENDSELAKYTITVLHEEYNKLKEDYKHLVDHDKMQYERIQKAIEYIEQHKKTIY